MIISILDLNNNKENANLGGAAALPVPLVPHALGLREALHEDLCMYICI